MLLQHTKPKLELFIDKSETCVSLDLSIFILILVFL